MSRTVDELLNSLTYFELQMWAEYFRELEGTEKLSVQVAQLTSVIANVNGNKTKTQDFMLVTTKKEKQSIEERVKESTLRLKKAVKNQ